MRRAIRQNARTFGAIIGLIAIAALVGSYILVHQRLQLPWEHTYTVRAEFVTAQAVTPGQGQQVTVSGVDVGLVSKVELRDGRAVVSMQIDRDKLASVGRDAHMLLRPKTPLQDMSIDLDPGPPGAPSIGDAIIPVRQTQANVNVDEVLAGLDTDTRAYVQTTLASFGHGLGGQGENLRRALEATSPAAAQLKELDTTLAGRRAQVKRLVGSLRSLTGALADQRQGLQQLVSAGSVTAQTVGAQSAPLQRSLDLLPDTLRRANRVLAKITPFSGQLAETATDLVPVAKHLDKTLAKVKPFVEDAKPTVDELRRLVPKAIPVAQQLNTSLQRLQPTTPKLTDSVKVARMLGNELAYIPSGKNHSYLFWVSWFGHNVGSMVSARDANSGVWRAIVNASCTSVSTVPQVLTLLKPLLDITSVCAKAP
jgi:phospholipid/cholesterol/gamma-HCH transport system substrate-binding protein